MSNLYMIVGLPASGKSTYAKQLSKETGAIVYSSDTLREELFGDRNVNDKESNNILFNELHRRMKHDLSVGKDVCFDATNIHYKHRRAFLTELDQAHISCKKICCFMATPYEKCLAEDEKREYSVGERVIRRMYLNFYVPQYYEGFDEINIIWNTDGYNYDLNELFNGENGLNKISQDNPNHSFTIGKHCLKCCVLCEKLTDDTDIDLSLAGLLHDIGKRFTKQFKNANGETTDIAHYFQHHLVSAYNSLFYLEVCGDQRVLNIANYIQWHMQPFFMKTKKARQRFMDMVGKDFYEKLMLLHKADVLAQKGEESV